MTIIPPAFALLTQAFDDFCYSSKVTVQKNTRKAAREREKQIITIKMLCGRLKCFAELVFALSCLSQR